QECAICHSRAANFLLGVSTVQLNRGNQIAEWERAGILTNDRAAVDEAEWRHELARNGLQGAPLQAMLALVAPSGAQRPPPKDNPLLARAVESLPRIANPHDPIATLNERA